MIAQNTLDFKLNALVCERAKVTWSEETLSHVSHFQSTLKSQWISSDNLADLLDTLDANYDSFDKPNASALGAANVRVSCQLFSIIFIFFAVRLNAI